MDDKPIYKTQYVQYLIENKDLIDIELVGSYLLNQIDFKTLISSVDVSKIKSFESFVITKKLDDLLD